MSDYLANKIAEARKAGKLPSSHEPVANSERINRDRPATNPGGMQCEACDEIFIGEEWHSYCAVCEALRFPQEITGERQDG